jgi:hypothetical protein
MYDFDFLDSELDQILVYKYENSKFSYCGPYKVLGGYGIMQG